MYQAFKIMDKNKLQQQWVAFAGAWVRIYDDFRLSLAAFLADFKYRASKGEHQYFVLPDEKDKLLVLSPADIDRLKKIGRMEYRNVYRRLTLVRKKNGTKKKRKVRVKLIGRKAFGISRMNHKVTTFDVRRECFYCSALKGVEKISEKEKEFKRAEWHKYLADERAYQREKKERNKKNEPKGLFNWIAKTVGLWNM